LKLVGKAFGRGWSEHFARRGRVFFAHHNLKSRAGPRQVFAHSSRRVTPDHCRNAGIFERALGKVRFRAATVGLDGNEVWVLLHSGIVCPIAACFSFAW
jgi:hypothetical protein